VLVRHIENNGGKLASATNFTYLNIEINVLLMQHIVQICFNIYAIYQQSLLTSDAEVLSAICHHIILFLSALH